MRKTLLLIELIVCIELSFYLLLLGPEFSIGAAIGVMAVQWEATVFVVLVVLGIFGERGMLQDSFTTI